MVYVCTQRLDSNNKIILFILTTKTKNENGHSVENDRPNCSVFIHHEPIRVHSELIEYISIDCVLCIVRAIKNGNNSSKIRPKANFAHFKSHKNRLHWFVWKIPPSKTATQTGHWRIWRVHDKRNQRHIVSVQQQFQRNCFEPSQRIRKIHRGICRSHTATNSDDKQWNVPRQRHLCSVHYAAALAGRRS